MIHDTAMTETQGVRIVGRFKYSRSGGQLIVLPVVVLLTALTFLALDSSGQADMTSADDELCLACHEGYMDGLVDGAHRLTSDGAGGMAIACVSCHPNGDDHLDNPVLGNIVNPANAEAGVIEAVCADCHNPHLEFRTAGWDAHLSLDQSCVSCHAVHKGTIDGQMIDADGDYCQTCHVSVANQFRKVSNHPLTDQNVTCASCHVMSPDAQPIMGHGPTETCLECHSDVAGPFRFTHAPASSFSAMSDEGCVSCHEPHGSSNDRLLNQTGDMLCFQCHGTPPTHAGAHNGEFDGLSCMECHSEVHGSFDNLFLLDPDLGLKLRGEQDGCFCHVYR